MVHQRLFTTTARSAAALALAVCASVNAQTPQSSAAARSATPARKIALASDVCPVVHIGEVISLDFAPAFDPAWAVTGLRSVILHFRPLDEEGVNFKSRGIEVGSRLTPIAISPLGNGYFHTEITVSGRLSPGTYRLTEVRASAEARPDYSGPEPQMTVSPVRDRYCITLVREAPPGS